MINSQEIIKKLDSQQKMLDEISKSVGKPSDGNNLSSMLESLTQSYGTDFYYKVAAGLLLLFCVLWIAFFIKILVVDNKNWKKYKLEGKWLRFKTALGYSLSKSQLFIGFTLIAFTFVYFAIKNDVIFLTGSVLGEKIEICNSFLS